MDQPHALHKQYARHTAPNSVEDLVNVMRDVCDRRGLAHLAYFGLATPSATDSDISLITTCGEKWVDRYFDQKYQRIDPVMTISSKSLLPMDWSKVEIDTEEMAQLYREAGEFGVGQYGLTVRVRGHDTDTGLVSASINCSAGQWQGLSDQLTCELLYLAVVLHGQILDLKALVDGTQKEILSRRERQVLEWAARGKTAWETGAILGVSERTVSFYIANACDKLGVTSKTHAVAKLISEQKIRL